MRSSNWHRGRQAERVRAETEQGRRLGVRSTPTLFVNGQKIEGVPTIATLDQLIANALGAGGAPARQRAGRRWCTGSPGRVRVWLDVSRSARRLSS